MPVLKIGSSLTASTTDNKIANGDFEQGLYNWVPVFGSSAPNIITDATSPVGGKVAQFPVQRMLCLQSQEYIPIDPSKTYFMECWAYVPPGAPNCYAGFVEFDQNYVFVPRVASGLVGDFGLFSGLESTNGSWQHFSFTISGQGNNDTNLGTNTFDVSTKYVCAALYINWDSTNGTPQVVRVAYMRFAEVQSGAAKNIDLLQDGSVYVRVKATEAQGGVIIGRSYGTNCLQNPGFEQNNSNTAVGDGWVLLTNDGGLCSYWRETNPSFVRSGSANLLIRLNDGQTLTNTSYLGTRIVSVPIQAPGGTRLFYGGGVRWDQNTGTPSQLSVIGRVGILYYDVNNNFLGESFLDVTAYNGAYAELSGYSTVPVNASYLRFECCLISKVSSSLTIPAGTLYADVRFDDVFLSMTVQQAELEAVTIANRGSALVGDKTPLVASDSGSSVTITVNPFQMQFSFGVVSYNGGSITGLPYGSKIYVYANDPDLTGGYVGFSSSTVFSGVVSSSGYVLVDSIVTPTQGGTSTAGGGGGPSTAPTQQSTESGWFAVDSTVANPQTITFNLSFGTSNVPTGHGIVLYANSQEIGSGLSGNATYQMASSGNVAFKLVDTTNGIVLQG